ncbi:MULTISPECIES: hypothetical protein [Mycobacterium]|uniref:Uncharacterized protein n=1 Tax=Mycobacterium kiyosense TaxID=2871094 RepID=A0A9P3Q3S2_9MYCO|nr:MULTISPECIES: hypothetical protein [Mycobacterium]BDB42684.1 hypothetical protein IWGMT90018_31300 [Mycobacterium kiyosense]BDE14063.1 hypothetical protein MKCMC460_29230 [Mycobacterium sp. 20KCMC460]GLB81181.1 hypothetical protein SRL2020028_04370 [Mycobacterium kiyosense]GLB88211.1 hypothetical protein SRL2020130_10280 [Mycobacterium kiyosense]GLB94517.1 hypothetical protein SRL2020226_12930 [Mycobacterium kiyosense]
MPDDDTAFPDDVPVGDAAEQQRLAADEPEDEETPQDFAGEVPLEADVADWREQQETVFLAPEPDELTDLDESG